MIKIHRRTVIHSLLAVAAIGSLGASSASAWHPFHVCVGQMQFNPKTSRWEVSLRMHPRDLELALSDLTKKNINREDPDFPKQVIDYLGNQFFLTYYPHSQDLKMIQQELSKLSAARSLEEGEAKWQSRSLLDWVGMESERGWLWIHFELTPPESSASSGPMYLVHRIFLDRIDGQENSVAILHTRSNRSSLQFKKGQAAKLFPLP